MSMDMHMDICTDMCARRSMGMYIDMSIPDVPRHCLGSSGNAEDVNIVVAVALAHLVPAPLKK